MARPSKFPERSGWLHADHRARLQFALGDAPLEERLEAAVAVQGGRRLPALQLVGDEVPSNPSAVVQLDGSPDLQLRGRRLLAPLGLGRAGRLLTYVAPSLPGT